MAPVRPVLRRLSCSNETVRNAPKLELLVKWSGAGAFVAKNSYAPKHEFWVQWSALGAFVAKNSDATLFSELVR
jgi:hypothetical protein